MKKIRRSALAAVFAFLTAVPGHAIAATIQAPAEDATVDRTFTITGTTGPDCQLGLFIDRFDDANLTFYIPPANRGEFRDLVGRGVPAYFRANGNGQFSIPVDLNGDAALQKGKGLQPVSAGNQAFQVRPSFCGDSTPATRNLVVEEAVTPVPATASPTPVTTPAPTPTPDPVKAEAAESWLDNLDPVLVLLVGAVAGGGATGLAEYSWIRYRRKRRLKQGL